MADVLDLRQFRAYQLEPLLQAESAEWNQALDWDYASSATLIRQYIDARILPGYVLLEHPRSPPCGYGFFIYEGSKGMVGNLFVAPDRRRPQHASERFLLARILQTMRATPGLERIEAQLMPFAPEALEETFAGERFRSYRRVFLHRDLASPTPPAPDLPGVGLVAWEAAWEGTGAPSNSGHEEAARLILRAYEGHVDSLINDQYRSFAGALRFMHNVANYPGCGAFDPGASFLARSVDHGSLEGMVLASRVKPEVAHITQVCVMPAHQRQGLGRALILHCLAEARRRHFRSATLTVTCKNEAALALYRELGFTTRCEFDAYIWERSPSGFQFPRRSRAA